MGNRSKVTAVHTRMIRIVIGLSVVFLITGCGSNLELRGSLPSMEPTPKVNTSSVNSQTQSPDLTNHPTVKVITLSIDPPTTTPESSDITVIVTPTVAPAPLVTLSPIPTVVPILRTGSNTPDFKELSSTATGDDCKGLEYFSVNDVIGKVSYLGSSLDE